MKLISINSNNGYVSIIIEKVCFIEVNKCETEENFKTVTFHFDNGEFVTAPKIENNDIDNILQTFCQG